jgi:hypothetical protein
MVKRMMTRMIYLKIWEIRTAVKRMTSTIIRMTSRTKMGTVRAKRTVTTVASKTKMWIIPKAKKKVKLMMTSTMCYDNQ